MDLRTFFQKTLNRPSGSPASIGDLITLGERLLSSLATDSAASAAPNIAARLEVLEGEIAELRAQLAAIAEPAAPRVARPLAAKGGRAGAKKAK